jgi:hypothetical protein
MGATDKRQGLLAMGKTASGREAGEDRGNMAPFSQKERQPMTSWFSAAKPL